MKKLILLCTILVVVVGACSGNKTLKNIKHSFYEATYYDYITGAGGGGRGMVFQIKFLMPNGTITCDSVWVNNIRMMSEMTRVKDTIFANAFYFEAGNPQSQETELPASDFFDADKFSGKMKVFIDEEEHFIKVDAFQKIQPPNLPY